MPPPKADETDIYSAALAKAAAMLAAHQAAPALNKDQITKIAEKAVHDALAKFGLDPGEHKTVRSGIERAVKIDSWFNDAGKSIRNAVIIAFLALLGTALIKYLGFPK